jgi:hypothetical protein
MPLFEKFQSRLTTNHDNKSRDNKSLKFRPSLNGLLDGFVCAGCIGRQEVLFPILP